MVCFPFAYIITHDSFSLTWRATFTIYTMITLTDRLSIGTLFRVFWGKIIVTWGLTLLETMMFALLPLLIGHSIDGLLADDWGAFITLLTVLGGLLIVATGRRVYDTRVYGTIRVELSKALVKRSDDSSVSIINARALMGRELVDFLEKNVPESMTAFVQIIVSVILLFSFHSTLALSAGIATIASVIIYALAANQFFKINRSLNEQSEQQISALESRKMRKVTLHFLRMRQHEVRMSDIESIVYGVIFLILLSMLSFNLWFAATQAVATPGEIFSIVTYSFELVGAAVVLPILLQSLTRLQEITERINKEHLVEN